MTLPRPVRQAVQTAQNFEKHNGASYAAAIAYHAIISLGPCLLLSVGLVSRVFEASAVVTTLGSSLTSLAGEEVAALVTELISDLTRPSSSGNLVALVTTLIIIYASTNVFRQIDIALDAIWEVEAPTATPRSSPYAALLVFARRYGLALLASVAVVVSLFVTMLASTLVGVVVAPVASQAPGLAALLPWLTALALPLLLFLICWLAFTWLPKVKLSWRETRNGALLTGAVLAVGGGIIGYYASHSPIPDLLGVASSLIILLLWMFFASLLFLLGAEHTRTLILNLESK